MQNNLLCPNCNTVLREDMVQKIHPNVFDELVYSDCSVETNNFLTKVFDYQKEKRVIMLNIIKNLDRENTSLKETNKSNQENLKTCELYLKSFQTERKYWQEKNKTLQHENNNLLRKLNNNEEVTNASEDSHMGHETIIEKSSSKDSCSTINHLVNESLLIFPYIF